MINMAEAGGSTWGNDDYILGQTTVIDTMFPDRMPIFVWREDLANIRDFLSNRLFGSGGCFEAAFGNLTNQPKRGGFVHPRNPHKARTGYSQFNVRLISFTL